MWPAYIMVPYVMSMFPGGAVTPGVFGEVRQRHAWATRRRLCDRRRYELTELMDTLRQRLLVIQLLPWRSSDEKDEKAAIVERCAKLNDVLGGSLRLWDLRYYRYARQLQGRAICSFLLMAFVWTLLTFIALMVVAMLSQLRVVGM